MALGVSLLRGSLGSAAPQSRRERELRDSLHPGWPHAHPLLGAAGAGGTEAGQTHGETAGEWAQPPWGSAPSGGAVPLGLSGSSHAGLVLLSVERGDDLGKRTPSPKMCTSSPYLGTLHFPSVAAPGLPPRARERLYLEWLAYLLAPGAVHWSGRLRGVRGAFRLCCPSAPRSTSSRSLHPPGRTGCLPAQLTRMIPSRHVQAPDEFRASEGSTDLGSCLPQALLVPGQQRFPAPLSCALCNRPVTQGYPHGSRFGNTSTTGSHRVN